MNYYSFFVGLGVPQNGINVFKMAWTYLHQIWWRHCAIMH